MKDDDDDDDDDDDNKEEEEDEDEDDEDDDDGGDGDGDELNENNGAVDCVVAAVAAKEPNDGPEPPNPNPPSSPPPQPPPVDSVSPKLKEESGVGPLGMDSEDEDDEAGADRGDIGNNDMEIDCSGVRDANDCSGVEFDEFSSEYPTMSPNPTSPAPTITCSSSSAGSTTSSSNAGECTDSMSHCSTSSLLSQPDKMALSTCRSVTEM